MYPQQVLRSLTYFLYFSLSFVCTQPLCAHVISLLLCLLCLFVALLTVNLSLLVQPSFNSTIIFINTAVLEGKRDNKNETNL